MPTLTDTELRMIAEVVTELARFRGSTFDKVAKGNALARAALIDPAFKVRLAEVHRRLEARRSTDLPVKTLAPIAPLFRDLLSSLVVAQPAAQQRCDLQRFDVATIAVDQAPYVERLRMLAGRAVRAQPMAGSGEEVAEGTDRDRALRRHAALYQEWSGAAVKTPDPSV